MNIQGNINAIIGTLASLKLDTERNKELKQARQATEAMNKKLEEERKQFEQSPEVQDARQTEKLYEQMQRGEIDFYGNPITNDPETYNVASIDRVMNRAIQKKVALKHRTKLKGGRN